MTTHQLIPEDHAVEPLDEGGTWLLDVVAAVDHLRRGIRSDPGALSADLRRLQCTHQRWWAGR